MPALFGQITFPIRFEPSLRLGVGRSFRTNTVSAVGTVGLQWDEMILTGCGDLIRTGRFSVSPCVDVEAGILEAIVLEPPPSRVRSADWFSAGVSAHFSWRPLAALSVELFGVARAPVIRNQLLFEPATLVYEAPHIVPFVGTAVVAHIF